MKALPGSRLRGSVAARLGIGYGLMMASAIGVAAMVFFAGTVGVLQRMVDSRINSVAQRLLEAYADGGQPALTAAIAAQLNDRIDSDTELVVVLSANGQTLAGNLRAWSGAPPPPNRLVYRDMLRDGRLVPARLVSLHLDGGKELVVGRDLSELAAIRGVIANALAAGCLVSLLAVFGGALLFRRLVERRIGRIRLTARQIEAGDMSRRIAVEGDDEFALLGRDINRMLDRIEQLMDGVRHVSNSIAHDLRTPLSRARTRLDEALRRAGRPGTLETGAQRAIEDIDHLSALCDKLLQIATAESGLRPSSYQRVDLQGIVADMVELYEAAAEDHGVRLVAAGYGPVYAFGDRDLLASALASLIDNAIKYAAPGVVSASAAREGEGVTLTVSDDGPGVPAGELDKISERFYRVDRSRHLPGNGLGLSIVSAIAKLHAGVLEVKNRRPGLEARILLPAAPVLETAAPPAQALLR